MEEKVLNYLIKVYGVYIELKDNNYEIIFSKQILDSIITTGKSIYSNNTQHIKDRLDELIFLLCFVNKLSENRRYGNYKVSDLDKVIMEGKGLCLDLEK